MIKEGHKLISWWIKTRLTTRFEMSTRKQIAPVSVLCVKFTRSAHMVWDIPMAFNAPALLRP